MFHDVFKIVQFFVNLLIFDSESDRSVFEFVEIVYCGFHVFNWIDLRVFLVVREVEQEIVQPVLNCVNDVSVSVDVVVFGVDLVQIHVVLLCDEVICAFLHILMFLGLFQLIVYFFDAVMVTFVSMMLLFMLGMLSFFFVVLMLLFAFIFFFIFMILVIVFAFMFFFMFMILVIVFIFVGVFFFMVFIGFGYMIKFDFVNTIVMIFMFLGGIRIFKIKLMIMVFFSMVVIFFVMFVIIPVLIVIVFLIFKILIIFRMFIVLMIFVIPMLVIMVFVIIPVFIIIMVFVIIPMLIVVMFLIFPFSPIISMFIFIIFFVPLFVFKMIIIFGMLSFMSHLHTMANVKHFIIHFYGQFVVDHDVFGLIVIIFGQNFVKLGQHLHELDLITRAHNTLPELMRHRLLRVPLVINVHHIDQVVEPVALFIPVLVRLFHVPGLFGIIMLSNVLHWLFFMMPPSRLMFMLFFVVFFVFFPLVFFVGVFRPVFILVFIVGIPLFPLVFVVFVVILFICWAV